MENEIGEFALLVMLRSNTNKEEISFVIPSPNFLKFKTYQ